MLHLDTLGVNRYALVTQADALGESGRQRMLVELARIGIRPVASEQLADHAAPTEVLGLMAKVCDQKPEAVMLATDAALARVAIAAARAQPCAVHDVVFSETGAALAARPPGSNGRHPLAGPMVTQVVPHPGNPLHPLSVEYQRALATHGAAPGSYPSLEAYLATRVIQEALLACGREAGRACLLHSLAMRGHELPGLKVQFDSEQRKPRPFVEITLLDGEGRFRR
jgi:ABC-type branched-subunit amino acid transport system substrate-binding protein